MGVGLVLTREGIGGGGGGGNRHTQTYRDIQKHTQTHADAEREKRTERLFLGLL